MRPTLDDCSHIHTRACYGPTLSQTRESLTNTWMVNRVVDTQHALTAVAASSIRGHKQVCFRFNSVEVACCRFL